MTQFDAPDDLGWERDLHGRMVDHATDDDAVETHAYRKGLRARLGLSSQNLPSALAGRGLKVETVAGWQTRSAGSFAPRGAVCHWTAGPATGDRPSLKVCINGRPGLSGPLCNVFLTRDGTAIVVAAGRANHAGLGGWKGLSGNSTVFGTEAESDGKGWTAAQRWAYPRVVAAYIDLGARLDLVCGHNEWAPTRKSDISDWPMSKMRSDVAAVLAGTHVVTPPLKPPVTEEDDMTPAQAAQLQRLEDKVNHLSALLETPIPGFEDASGKSMNPVTAAWYSGYFGQQAQKALARIETALANLKGPA